MGRRASHVATGVLPRFGGHIRWPVAGEKKGTQVFISGQVAVDRDGELAGAGDCKAQTEQVFKNVETALSLVGATMDDVVKITCFLVNVGDYSDYAGVRRRVFPENGPASATVIVKELVRPEFLVEVDAFAIVG